MRMAGAPGNLPPPAASRRELGPTVTARLHDGPLVGSVIETELVEGRPRKTIDAPAPDGSTYRYCLEGWGQTGRSAAYAFLYRVWAGERLGVAAAQEVGYAGCRLRASGRESGAGWGRSRCA